MWDVWCCCTLYPLLYLFSFSPLCASVKRDVKPIWEQTFCPPLTYFQPFQCDVPILEWRSFIFKLRWCVVTCKTSHIKGPVSSLQQKKWKKTKQFVIWYISCASAALLGCESEIEHIHKHFNSVLFGNGKRALLQGDNLHYTVVRINRIHISFHYPRALSMFCYGYTASVSAFKSASSPVKRKRFEFGIKFISLLTSTVSGGGEQSHGSLLSLSHLFLHWS